MTWKADMQAPETDNNEPGAPGLKEAGEAPGGPEPDLEKARAEAAEWQDRFLRKAAEFENYRKRMGKENADAMMLAKSSVLLEFLPVVDACERALETMEKGGSVPEAVRQYHEGVQLLYRQLLDTFSRAGVVPIESEGKPFDPHLHEALSSLNDAGCREDTVVQELRRGYLFKDRLLRPAQVIVAVSSEAQEGEES